MTSAFRKQLQPASYKGVPFLYRGHELAGGKRIVDHLFPYRDDAFTESLGKKQRIFTLDAYILGEDYFKQRDDLIKALESDGAGTLVHPYLGKKNVEAVDYNLSETSTDGGMAYFSITFHETAAKPSADIKLDVRVAAEKLDTKIDETLIEQFLRFDTSAISDINLSRITDIVDQGLDAIYKAREFIPSNDFGLSELAFGINAAKRGIRALISKPIQLANQVVSGGRLLKSMLTLEDFGPRDQFGRDLLKDPNAFKEAVFGARKKRDALKAAIAVKAIFPSYEGETLSKLQLRENTRLYGNLIKGSFLSKMVGVSIQTVYATYEEAVEHRRYLISEIEEFLSDPLIDDETYQNFQDLLVIIADGVPSEFAQEARLSTIDVSASLPSLVLSYDVYDSLQLEADLISRNKIVNPAFFKLGKIEVIAGD